MEKKSLIDKILHFCLSNRLVVLIGLILLIFWSVLAAPFNFGIGEKGFVSKVPVDAIPDIGENQQIVFTQWEGFSPRDIEDQITYPLTAALLSTPGVKSVRGFSMFGFSSIYVIFEEGIDFYWSRSRILEKINSLPKDLLPKGVQPTLGPDATALGQVFWYTLEGRDEKGNPTGGWDPHELRSIQDWTVRYALLSAPGISEVASIGGFVKEYQVDVDPDKMKAYNVTLEEVLMAVKGANIDVGARTMEVNSVEYVVRGIGLVEKIEDLEKTAIKSVDGQPIFVGNIGTVSLGPALRRGVLNKEGADSVGGVVVVRYGFNPLEAIENVKKKIAQISPSLPSKRLDDGRMSQLHIVPFYDRTELIHETLNTLSDALILEIIVTAIVVMVLLNHLRSALLITSILPLSVLFCFLMMRWIGVDANIVSLSGIAIAIGTMVDMGIVISESIVARLEKKENEPLIESVFKGTSDVAPAVLTALATTVVGFLPVFAMEGAEGKLFKPLAFTKTFALISAMALSLLVLPAIGTLLLRKSPKAIDPLKSGGVALGVIGLLLTYLWVPLGLEAGWIINGIFVFLILAFFLGGAMLFIHFYPYLLEKALEYWKQFLLIPAFLVLLGGIIGFSLPKEFMPPLDEGSFLYMPTTMPHASIAEAEDVLKKQNILISKIPEVSAVVGKIGRAESPLDPAPISMVETVIHYHPKYYQNAQKRTLFFKIDEGEEDFARNFEGEKVLAPDGMPYKVKGKFKRDDEGRLIEAGIGGKPFPMWRPPLDPDINKGRDKWSGIETPDGIWKAITDAAQLPGSTSAPKLQPIMTRIVMLQSGMRAPMGIKIKGPSLEAVEKTGMAFEKALREIPEIQSETVNADRVIAKPYLEITIDREAIARYGLKIGQVQKAIEVAIGGKGVTTTVEGRERYPVRVRYLRELRDSIESIGEILVEAGEGVRVPLEELASVEFSYGPQVIKSEEGFLVSYLTFGGRDGYSENQVVDVARQALTRFQKEGALQVEKGVSYSFAGTFENQMRAERKLMWILPATLLIIFTLLYLQFHSVATSLFIFSGILVAWSGGFILIWLYGQSWFLNLSVFGHNLRDLFQIHPINLSVAIWVGFLALFGIASDNGVLVASAIDKELEKDPAKRRDAIVKGALKRVRPAVMTSATTLLALLPVLTSTGRGSDIMIPMAIPSFGGMLISLITLFVVPVLYSIKKAND